MITIKKGLLWTIFTCMALNLFIISPSFAYHTEQEGSYVKMDNVFANSELYLGGFFHTVFTSAAGEDNHATSFNKQHFELIADMHFNDSWSAYVAQGFKHESDIVFTDAPNRFFPEILPLSTTAPLDLAWGNYRHNDWVNLKGGRYKMPHGIYNIDFFPTHHLDPDLPQFLRPVDGQTIFPRNINGLELHGHGAPAGGGNIMQYYVYLGIFSDTPQKLLGGGRLAYTLPKYGVTAAINTTYGARYVDAASRYFLFGADLKYDRGPWLVQSELFYTREALGEDRLAFYIQVEIFSNCFDGVFARFDYLRGQNVFRDLSGAITIDDVRTISGHQGSSYEYVAGVNYLPIPPIRLRAIFYYDNLKSGIDTIAGPLAKADLLTLRLSATFSFG